MNKLPQAIAEYIDAANAKAAQRAAACFHDDAIVHDEGHTLQGREQIAAWIADTAERYGSTIEATGIEEADGRHILQAAVRGNFPSSPVTLYFHFQLRSGSIQSLEIKP